MAATERTKRKAKGKRVTRASAEELRRRGICSALKHPIRVRILEALEEAPKSPSQFVTEGLFPVELYADYKQALSLSAYHFRQLAEEGCIEVVEEVPRRGATEHIYRSLSRVYFTDAEFEAMSQGEREMLSRSSMQGMIARAEGAMRGKTFDTRSDRHLAWMALRLDERGWSELMTSLAACFGEVEQIKLDAGKRLDASGDEVVFATFGMLGFESPPPPKPRTLD